MEVSGKVRFALLGCGRIGQVHAQTIAFNEKATLRACFDPFPAAAEAISTKYGCEVLSIEMIESNENIDAVLICTPTDTHADFIERFAKTNKAIFCEKPVDLDISRVQECIKTITESQANVMIGFNRRFDPHFLALKLAIEKGEIGSPELCIITSRDPGLPPAEYISRSGGIFRDMTCHDFDMSLYLMGEMPDSVLATGSALVADANNNVNVAQLGDFDTVSIIMRTPSGKQIIISNSRRASYGYDQRIEVHGSKGMITAENQRPISIEIANSQGFTKPPLHDFFITRYREAYENEVIDIYISNYVHTFHF